MEPHLTYRFDVFWCIQKTGAIVAKNMEALQLACQDDQCGFFDTGIAEHGEGTRGTRCACGLNHCYFL